MRGWAQLLAARAEPGSWRGRASAGMEGLGLGLHSTQLLVRAHHGRIRAEATPGGGATFRVELPAAEAGSGPSPGSDPRPAVSVQRH